METTRTRIEGTWLRRWLPVSLGIAITVLIGTTDAWAKGNAPVQVASVPVTDPTTEVIELAELMAEAMGPFAPPASAFDAAYAQREQASAGLERFQGGDALIISGSAVVLVLLIVLLIVLI
jgi:hypothetical protein